MLSPQATGLKQSTSPENAPVLCIRQRQEHHGQRQPGTDLHWPPPMGRDDYFGVDLC